MAFAQYKFILIIKLNNIANEFIKHHSEYKYRTRLRDKNNYFMKECMFTCLDFSSLACAFICWTSMESGLRLLINRSWLPIHKSRILTNNTWAAVSLLCSFNFKAIKPLTQLPTSDCFFTSLFMRVFCEKNMKFGEVFSTGLIMNFLSSKLIWRISDHVNVVFGASLFSFS